MHPKIICTIITGRNSRCARSRSLWPRSYAPAAAQGWGEDSYPDFAFPVAFPANPQVDTTTYQITDNCSVPARIAASRFLVYSVRQANVVFSMIVAELKDTNLKESAVVGHAIKMLSQNATVRLNIPARIYRVYGRQLTSKGGPPALPGWQ